MTHSYQVGQKILEVITLNTRGSPKKTWHKITKIGRKWVHYGEGYLEDKFDIETGQIFAGNFCSPGKVYSSEEEYTNLVERRNLWDDLYRKLSFNCPSHLTNQDIRSIHSMIFKEDK